MATPPLLIPLAANTEFWCNGSVYLVAPQDLVPDHNNQGNWVPSAGAQKLNQVQANPNPPAPQKFFYVPVVEVSSAQAGVAVANAVAQVLILKPSLIAGGYVGGAAMFNPNLNFASSDATPVTIPATGVQPIACWLQGATPPPAGPIPPASMWQPSAADLAAADPGGHVCMAATSYLNTDEQQLGPNLFFPVGSTDGNPWQGQRNIHIVASVQGQIRYGFFAGNPRVSGAPLNLTVAAVHHAAALTPPDVKALKASPLAHLTFQTSPLKPKTVAVVHTPVHIIGHPHPQLAEKLAPAPLPTPPSVHGQTLKSVGVAVKPAALANMQISLELDPNEKPGNVQVMDLVQIGPNGKVMGGIHLLGVVT